MIEIVKKFPNQLLIEEAKLCITLYQPAHRNSGEHVKDQVVYKNLLRNLEEELNKHLSKLETDQWMAPLNEVKEDRGFWQGSLGGIGIFSAEGKAILYRLREEVEPQIMVGDAYYITPLIEDIQKNKEFFLLGLSLSDFTLLKGDYFSMEEVVPEEGTPRTLKEVEGEQHTDGFLTHGSYAGPGRDNAIFHGQGARKDEVMKDLEKYFRYVDKYVNQEILKLGPRPLVLVSLKEHQGEFRKISDNPYLVSVGVLEAFDPYRKEDQIYQAKAILEEERRKEDEKTLDLFRLEMSRDLASDDIVQIQKASDEKRIRMLIMAPPLFEPVDLGDQGNRDKLLKEKIAISVIKNGGEVMISQEEWITPFSKIGAIFRYG